MKLKNSTHIPESDHYPRGNCTIYGFTVEVRMNSHEPKEAMGVIFDNRWRKLECGSALGAIPASLRSDPIFHTLGMLTRHEAEALRWLTICALDANHICGSLCLETRIVKHEVRYSYEAKPVEYVDAFDNRGNVPEDMAEREPESESQ